MRFLISRVDAIGDVVLTLPMAAILKQHFPNAKILFLAREYVRVIVESCPDVDEFVSWDHINSLNEHDGVTAFKELNADIIFHVKPNINVAKLAKAAQIQRRIGSSRRWFHWLYCNKHVKFSRAKSNLHEAQLNLKLLKPLKIKTDYTIDELIPYIRLEPKQTLTEKVKPFIDPKRFNLILHPLSHGSAREWPLHYYRDLIHALPKEKFNIIISGTAAERDRLQSPLLDQCPGIMNSAGILNLADLLILTKYADGFIASSTGPLHIAAAIGIKTLGLFPALKGINVTRWGPIGKQAQYLQEKDCVKCPFDKMGKCPCMEAITVDSVLTTLRGMQ